MNELPSQLTDVNTTDIPGAIRLGCETMQRVFNADDPLRTPFFGAQLLPETQMSFNSCHGESHVPGRHLNALLNAEDAVGVAIDECAVETHARAAFYSFSGPLPFPLNRERISGPLVNFCPHNLREGFHALFALTRFRDSREAAELAERCIAAVTGLWKPDRGWDEARIRAAGLNFQRCESFLHGEARLLGPLVKYYGATRSDAALRLATTIAEKAVAECFLSDGEFDSRRFGTTHAHSVTCVLSSLAQLADLVEDDSLLGRVRAFYDKGLWWMRDEIGWSPEAIGQSDTDQGEANNTGDILETALILAAHGHPQYYHDAERILRCHLLPCQLRDISFAGEAPNPDGLDHLRDVPWRLRGAFGFPAAYGHQPVPHRGLRIAFNLDIVGGAVGSLCEAWRAATHNTEDGHSVNLLFDHESEALRVQSRYTHPALRIVLKRDGPLRVRLPPWTRPEQLLISSSVPPSFSDGWLRFAVLPAGQSVMVRFRWCETEITLSDRVHPRPIRVKLRGDSVAAMEHSGAALRFFPELSVA